MSDLSVSKEELSNLVLSDKPHVIILGAGASRAVCPNGDKNGKKLPLMNDLVDSLNLKSKLKELDTNPNQNFEDLFSSLYEKKEFEKTNELEYLIRIYMDELRLPDKPTIYDHLVLSLRDKDFIASFNWDPLLLHAYHRNSNHGIELPRLAFLHGNVRQGFCEEHKRVNYLGAICERCQKPLKPTSLLYPIKKKNYAENEVIRIQWDRLAVYLDNAFMLTIFGYSGPRTDEEAINIIKKHWTKQRFLDDTNFITKQDEDEAYEHWKPFINSHHFRIYDDFYKSELANYPRRTFENSWTNNAEAKFTEENPIPTDINFPELWKWYHQFTEAEKDFRKKHPFPPPPEWYPKK